MYANASATLQHSVSYSTQAVYSHIWFGWFHSFLSSTSPSYPPLILSSLLHFSILSSFPLIFLPLSTSLPHHHCLSPPIPTLSPSSFRYDPDTGQWGLVCSMTFARSTAGLAVLDGKLYAVGGRDSMSCLNSAECYDPHTNKWTQLPKMAVKRGGLSLSAFNRRLYAVGGHDNNTPLDAVEVYDPSTNQWSLSCPLSCPRDACSTVIYGSCLYVIGGYNGSSYLDMMEECDEECQEWRMVSTLVAGRAGAGCAVFHLPLERVPGIVLEEEG